MEKEVIISDPAAPVPISDARKICHVCQRQFSQYTCPRCNSRYCSVSCYKRHSIRCTESFMRENVMEEMQQIQPDDETRRKMMDILKRFHLEHEMGSDEEGDGGDDDDSMLSEETIEKVLSGNKIRLEDLSPEEIKQFQRALASGELSKMIQPWTPWWTKVDGRTRFLSQEGSQLVRPHNEHKETTACQSSDPEDDINEIPAGPESPLPPLSELSRLDPSPLLLVHLVEILYSYCFTLRLYNGDWRHDPLGAANVVLSMSKVLGDGGQLETITEALGTCLEQTCSPAYRHTGGFKFGVGLIGDIICLLSRGGHALICALCDLRRLIKASKITLKSVKMEKSKSIETRQKLTSAERKLYFLMCWVNEQVGEVWPSLAGTLEVEKASLLATCSGDKPARGVKEKKQTRVLIEEV